MKGWYVAFSSVLRWSFLCAFLFTLVPALEARRGSDDDDDRDEITRIVTLTRTDNAPADARGVAKLEVGHRGDPASKCIDLDTFNLVPDTYTVTVFDSLGGSAVLGTFTAGLGDDDDDGDGGNSGPGGRGSGDGAAKRGGGDDNDEGESDFNLPDSVSALNLTIISVTDGGGAEVLAGDLSDATNVQNGRLRARARVVGTDAAPDVNGRAEIRGQQRRGKESGQFRIDARGLPASTTVVVSLDGTNLETVTTDRRGRLRLRKSARDVDIFSISTVSIRDEGGTELAQGQF